MKDEQTIGVFFGGRSPEHDVSIITGQLIIKGLRDLKKNVVPIYISKEGHWYADQSLASVEFFKDESYPEKLKALPHFLYDVRGPKGKMFLIKPGFREKQITIDLAFPAFHGPNGEDGVFQGIFEAAGIPYVGCGVTSSGITMDKALTKLLLQQHQLPTSQFVYVTSKEWGNFKENVLATVEQIGFPLFVKPARSGSSIGIAKVNKKEELEFALDVAFHYDTKVVVEKGVQNLMDLTICIIGNHEVTVSQIQESVFDDDFFSYDDKYLVDGGAQIGNADKKIIIPAEIPKKIEEQIKEAAKRVYHVFECRGIARVDFLFDKVAEEFYITEVNTLPGTLYHHLWKKSGLEFPDLLKELLKFAEEEWNEKQSVTYSFESDILKHAGGKKGANKLG